MASLYIAAGDAAEGGGFALGEGFRAPQAVAELYYLRLTFAKDAVHVFAQAQAGLAVPDALSHVVLLRDDVHERKCVPIPVHVYGLRQRHIPCRLFQSTKVHQYLIFTAAGGICGEADAFFGAIGVDAFDEADGADGDEVIGVVGLGVVFLDDVRHETEVVLDEHVARLNVAGEP